MDKYVIVMTDDAGTTQYWNGNYMVDDKDACFVYSNKIDARSAMAGLVSGFNTFDLTVRKVTPTLTIE